MMDLVTAGGALVGVLVASYYIGKKRKQEGLAKIFEQPESVARLYLRAAPEIDAYWLHAEFKSGKKVRIAAPWEIVDTLKQLEVLGLTLSPECWDRNETDQTKVLFDDFDRRDQRNRRDQNLTKMCS